MLLGVKAGIFEMLLSAKVEPGTIEAIEVVGDSVRVRTVDGDDLELDRFDSEREAREVAADLQTSLGGDDQCQADYY